MVIRAPGRPISIPMCDVDENTKRRSPKGSTQLGARGEGWHKKVIKAGSSEKRWVQGPSQWVIFNLKATDHWLQKLSIESERNK